MLAQSLTPVSAALAAGLIAYLLATLIGPPLLAVLLPGTMAGLAYLAVMHRFVRARLDQLRGAGSEAVQPGTGLPVYDGVSSAVALSHDSVVMAVTTGALSPEKTPVTTGAASNEVPGTADSPVPPTNHRPAGKRGDAGAPDE